MRGGRQPSQSHLPQRQLAQGSPRLLKGASHSHLPPTTGGSLAGTQPVRAAAGGQAPPRTVGSLLSVARWQAGDCPSWSAGGPEGSLGS